MTRITASSPPLLVALFLLTVPHQIAAQVGGPATGDWSSWRGPEQCGFSRLENLPATFSVDGENHVWSYTAGGARSAPVAWNGRVVFLHLTGKGPTQQEEVLCLDGASGEVLWRHAFNVFLTDIPSTRVGWSKPTIDPATGNVYVHGVQGLFICLDRDGKKIWERSLTEEFGRISGYGGRTHTPVVDEDRVVISFLSSAWGSHSKGTHRYLALDKRTGRVIWWSEPAGKPLDTTYSTPVIAVVDGVRSLIAGNADGCVYALESRTGRRVWKFRLSKRGLNSSVVVQDGLVWACHSEENVDTATMGRVVCFRASGAGDITETNEVWRHDALTAGYSTPALADGKLYVCDNSANVHCFDAKSGKHLWEHNVGTVMKASPVVADGKLYVGEVSGHFSILRLGENGAETTCRRAFKLPDGRPKEINGSACVVDGRVVFSTFTDLHCIGVSDWRPAGARVPESPTEEKARSDAKPAHLSVVPAEIHLTPGGNAYFSARLFDDKGRYLREGSVRWSVDGLDARVDAKGRLRIPADSSFQGGVVVATDGSGLTARARVRVVPRLPLEIDFEDLPPGPAPAGWVGATGVKFRVVEVDGTKALEKVPDKPKFILANAYIGLPTTSGYTIQADVMGTEKRFQLPNVGILGNRYELVLMGNAQQVRLVSWAPMPRVKAQAKFTIDPQIWYRMKLRIDVEGGEARVRGKVWDRKAAEPAAWTVELVDPRPNLSGAPGIQAYSAGATDKAAGAGAYWDNIKIVAK